MPGGAGLAPRGGPLELRLDPPGAMDRWRPFVHWLLAVPHLIVMWGLSALRSALTIIAFFTVLFTTRIPDGIYGLLVLTYRYQARVVSYVAAMRSAYPPFTFDTTAEDPGDDPLRLAFQPQPQLQRWAPLYKWLIALPHYVCLFFLGIAAFAVWIVAAFAVLFTGRFPDGMHRFLVGVGRWSVRVSTYVGLLHDEYPPFSLE